MSYVSPLFPLPVTSTHTHTDDDSSLLSLALALLTLSPILLMVHRASDPFHVVSIYAFLSRA